MQNFYNTIQANEQLLIDFNAAAKSQEDKILEVYKVVKAAAWFEVAKYLPNMDTSSLKRAISNLAGKGYLVKDTQKSNMVIGIKGKPCHKYILNTI